MHILLVEDNELARAITVEVLERTGHDVTAVENGLAGFAELQNRPFDAIVCDYRLPFLGGSSFHQKVKEDFPTLAARTVFVTGWANDPAVRDELAATGQPVLAKPYNVKRLLDILQTFVEPNPDHR